MVPATHHCYTPIAIKPERFAPVVHLVKPTVDKCATRILLKVEELKPKGKICLRFKDGGLGLCKFLKKKMLL